MDNQAIIEKLFKIQQAVRTKNPAAASAIERAIIPLLEHDAQLAEASRAELLKIKGIGMHNVDILLKIINGATLYEVVSNVTATKKRSFSR